MKTKKSKLKAKRYKKKVCFTKGFRRWKKGLEKFGKHNPCKCHHAATTSEVTLLQKSDLGQMIRTSEIEIPRLNR